MTLVAPCRIAGKAARGGEPDELHPLLLGVGHLALAARHVLAVAPVEALDRCRPLPDGRAHAVHRRVAAADHHHPLAGGVQLAALEFGHGIAETEPVAGSEIVDGPDDSLRPRAGGLQVAALVDAGGDDHCVMDGTDFLKRDILAHIAIEPDLHPALLKLVVAAHHHVLLQLEAGDAIGHQPARAVIPVIDGDLHACAAQHVRRRQSARPRTDDPHRLGALHARGNRLDPAFLPGGVGDVFLHRSDGHGSVSRLLDHAIAFAKPVLRADAAANLGKGVGDLAQFIGLTEPALGGEAQPVGDVVVQRAVCLAIGHTALAASAGLLLRLLIRVFCVDLLEIRAAQIGRALVGHVAFHGHETQHGLLGHGRLSDFGLTQA